MELRHYSGKTSYVQNDFKKFWQKNHKERSCLPSQPLLTEKLMNSYCGQLFPDGVNIGPGARACDAEDTHRVHKSLANKMFHHCGCWCLYDYENPARTSFQWVPGSGCWMRFEGPGGEAECMGLDEQRWAVEHRTSLCEAPMEVFLEEVALSQLRAGEGICRKVLTGSLGPGPESQEWATEAAEPSEDGSLRKFGRLQTVKQSPVRPAWALELSLREVCKDECKELVQGIRDEVDHIVEDLQNASFAESCAQRVVKRVEADILGCCADSCGWNSKTCVWWPFFSRTQRAQWEGECCAEQNILEGSERERMCDATLTKEQKEKLPRYSMNKDINGALIGQDRLVWMPSGVPHDRKDRAVSGDTVSNNFLLNSDVSARQGIHDKWWQDGVPATESSLLQHHYGEHGQRGLRSHSAELSKCLEPFKAMSVAQELAGKWMMIPALYFPTECGTPEAEGQGPDDLGEACMAFKQNAKGDPVCFDVNKKASQTEWGKVWHFASVMTKDSADRLKTMRTLVFLKQSLRP